MALEHPFSAPSELRLMKAGLQEAALKGREDMREYELTRSLNAGWCNGQAGERVRLNDDQAAALRAHHGADLLKEVAPAAEGLQDDAPAVGSEPPAPDSLEEPPGAPPAAETDHALEEGQKPANRMVSHSGRGGGGKSKS